MRAFLKFMIDSGFFMTKHSMLYSISMQEHRDSAGAEAGHGQH
jgi:hypothetical protein